MKTIQVKELILGALAIALIFIATLLFKIPNGVHGYVHLGDGFLLLFASFLSPVLSFLLGAIGSALADLAGGYGSYALFTFLIKGLEGAIVSFLLSKNAHQRNRAVRISAYIATSGWMLFGYFLSDAYINQSWQLAAVAVFGNLLQGGVGILIAVLAYPSLAKLFERR